MTPRPLRAQHASVATSEPCDNCGRETAVGSPLFSDRRRTTAGGLLCAECAAARERPWQPPEVDVPIRMPNANFPNTH